MERAAAGITAKLNIKNYPVHQALLDFVLLDPDKFVWTAGSTTIYNFLVAYKEKFGLKTLTMPTLPCSFETALLGIKQRASGLSTAAAIDAAGATAPPVPPGFPAANPALANGPHAGGGHLQARTATPAATPVVAVMSAASDATPPPATAP